MANYIKTVIKFTGLTEDETVELVNSITRNDPDDMINHPIDFGKIIPEPETPEECPKKYILKGERTPESNFMKISRGLIGINGIAITGVQSGMHTTVIVKSMKTE